MLKERLISVTIIVVGALLGWFIYASEINATRPFKLGLDLSGGTSLLYRADVSSLPSSDVADSMESLRDTIERRVNAFGVGEPIVQTERGGALAGAVEERLIVELPGITDTERAIQLIGQTPVLEFRMLKAEMEGKTPEQHTTVDDMYEEAVITGKHLSRAELQFGNGGGISNQPVVVLNFNDEGAEIFERTTRENVGRTFGIFLDGVPISSPVIQEAIPGGSAVISGNFTPDVARELVRNLNFGALPVPIELISSETVGGTLGAQAVERGVMAAAWGFAAVILFMILWYRVPGLIASVALILYGLVVLAIFKLIPVTLTAAGIAAFILSVGMAVDANVLIFARMREELLQGRNAKDAIAAGFSRAWPSIRDSNISSMLTAVILYSFGTSIVKGFALVFGLGVLVSMLTAITVSRTMLRALGMEGSSKITRFLFGSGIRA